MSKCPLCGKCEVTVACDLCGWHILAETFAAVEKVVSYILGFRGIAFTGHWIIHLKGYWSCGCWFELCTAIDNSFDYFNSMREEKCPCCAAEIRRKETNV